MNLIFADTSFFIGLVDRDDQTHERAIRFASSNRVPLITTSAVILELGAFFAQSRLRPFFSACLEAIKAGPVEVIHVDAALQQRAAELFASRSDKNWSLTDCIPFLAMQDRNLHEAATTDKHFQEANLIALLREPGAP